LCFIAAYASWRMSFIVVIPSKPHLRSEVEASSGCSSPAAEIPIAADGARAV